MAGFPVDYDGMYFHLGEPLHVRVGSRKRQAPVQFVQKRWGVEPPRRPERDVDLPLSAELV